MMNIRKNAIETNYQQEVWNEAQRLFNKLQFTAARGAYREGDHCALRIKSYPGETNGLFDVLVTIFPLNQPRRLAETRLILTEQSNGFGVLHYAKTNYRGQAWFKNLYGGLYNIRLARHFGHSQTAVPIPLSQVLAASSQESEPSKPTIFQSEDGKIIATLRITEHDETILAFETEAEELAETVVSFRLIGRNTRKVMHSGEVTLQPTDEPGVWEGRCSLGYKLRAPEPCEIMFDVSPLA